MYKFLITILFVSLTTLNSSCESKSKNKILTTQNEKTNTQNEKPNTGKVIAIIDGDTYDILLQGNETVRVRMEGIDAPEKGMPFYQASKKHLSNLCFGKEVSLKYTGEDSHDRKLAFSYLQDGRELSHEMIKAGLAWHFKKYNTDADLAQLEVEARKANHGIWSLEDPMTPWNNRELHRNGISTKDSFDIQEGQR